MPKAAGPDAVWSSKTFADPVFRRDIEGLRALAVLAVVAFHFFPSYLPGGYLGVDVFFVISGYLITGLILRHQSAGDFTLADFYARRVRRLFPAMLLVLATCMLAATVLLFSFELDRFARHVTASLFYVQNFNLASELGYFDHDAHGKPLLHFWSLAIEEQFYIVWPILLLVVAHLRKGTKLALASAIAAASLVWMVGPANGDTATFFDPLARAWELGVGAMLAAYEFGRSEPSISPRIAPALSMTAFTVLAAGMLITVPEGMHPGWWTLLPVLATACVIACGPCAAANRTLLAYAPAVWTGQISYALYLWHWPLLAFPVFVLGDKPSGIIRLGLLALSFLLAAATWRWLERPLRARRDVKRIAAILVFAAAALLGATWGAVAWRNANPDARQARIEQALEGPLWAFTSNAMCAARYPIPADHPFCMLSRDAGPTLVLAGNSFANHLYYGFATDPRTRGETVLSYGSCNHMAAVEASACAMQTQAAEEARARILVISELWPEFTPDGTMVDPVTRLPVATAPDRERFSRKLRAWISRMAGPETAIVIVGPKPELAYDAKHCFERPFRPASQNCTRPAASAEANLAPTRTLLTELAASLPNARYVEVADVFCRGTTCSYLDVEGFPLLRDNGHLSREGSQLVVGHILDQLATPIDATTPAPDRK